MKKGLSILLIAVYMFGATDAYQLLKIPALINHFIVHRTENHDITFAQFFEMHYNGKITIDADFEKDMQLPFKTHETECCISIATVLPAPVQLKFKTPETVSVEYNILNDDVPAYLIPAAIFQPPRV
ncbi:MAG TPA: hypothetical protein PLP23_06920 [Panacibacter sp.]|nr:hypothetical protein [Panacibacter sp.]